MICKFCFAELEEEASVCPVCGKDLTETPTEEVAEEILEAETEDAADEEIWEEASEDDTDEEEAPAKKKSKPIVTVLSTVAILVLAFFLTYAVLKANPTPGTTAFVEKMDKFTQSLKFWEKPTVQSQDSYTVDNETAEKNVNEVVATLGDLELTSGELQIYYWTSVYDYVDYYAYYLNMIGLDISKPLDEQIFNEETGQTYQQMFLEDALKGWQQYACLIMQAKEENVDLSEKEQEYLEKFRKQFEELATEYKYTDYEAFIDNEFFPGCSVDAYTKYNKTSYTALTYYDTLYKRLLPTQEQIEAYFTEHTEELEESGFGKDAGNYYDVRHILITPDGDGSGTYTDQQWEDCRVEAQKLLDDFLAGEATESVFAELAYAKSDDTGSVTNGGLYSELTKDTSFVQEFKDWYLDESRKEGDTGLVKTDYGYHIMYFSGTSSIWETETQNAIMSEGIDKVLTEAQEKWPLNVNYKKIVLGTVDLDGE